MVNDGTGKAARCKQLIQCAIALLLSGKLKKYTGLFTITITVTNIKLKITKNDLIKQNKNNKN